MDCSEAPFDPKTSAGHPGWRPDVCPCQQPHADPEDHQKRLLADGSCRQCGREIDREDAELCPLCGAPGIPRTITWGYPEGETPDPCIAALMLYGHYCELSSDANGRPLASEVDRTLERMGVTDPEQAELIRSMWSACTSVIADEQERQMDALRKAPAKGAPH